VWFFSTWSTYKHRRPAGPQSISEVHIIETFFFQASLRPSLVLFLLSFHDGLSLPFLLCFRSRHSPEANELWLLRLQSLPYPAQVKSIIQQSEVEKESLQSQWSHELKAKGRNLGDSCDSDVSVFSGPTVAFFLGLGLCFILREKERRKSTKRRSRFHGLRPTTPTIARYISYCQTTTIHTTNSSTTQITRTRLHAILRFSILTQ
jgi:hypothetical protein